MFELFKDLRLLSIEADAHRTYSPVLKLSDKV